MIIAADNAAKTGQIETDDDRYLAHLFKMLQSVDDFFPTMDHLNNFTKMVPTSWKTKESRERLAQQAFDQCMANRMVLWDKLYAEIHRVQSNRGVTDEELDGPRQPPPLTFPMPYETALIHIVGPKVRPSERRKKFRLFLEDTPRSLDGTKATADERIASLKANRFTQQQFEVAQRKYRAWQKSRLSQRGRKGAEARRGKKSEKKA